MNTGKNFKETLQPIKEEWVVMTPQKAKEYIDNSNVFIRPLSQHIVSKYASQMLSNNFQLNPENNFITIDKIGNIMNGNHRLNAIVKSGKTYRMKVYHLDEENPIYITDIGKTRTTADITGINKNKIYIIKTLESVISFGKPVIDIINYKTITDNLLSEFEAVPFYTGYSITTSIGKDSHENGFNGIWSSPIKAACLLSIYAKCNLKKMIDIKENKNSKNVKDFIYWYKSIIGYGGMTNQLKIVTFWNILKDKPFFDKNDNEIKYAENLTEVKEISKKILQGFI